MTNRQLPARLSPRPVRTLRERFVRSGFYADLYNDRHFIAALVVLAVCGLLVLYITQGSYVAWDGLHEIPTKPSCGDYCGTDAGLIPAPAE